MQWRLICNTTFKKKTLALKINPLIQLKEENYPLIQLTDQKHEKNHYYIISNYIYIAQNSCNIGHAYSMMMELFFFLMDSSLQRYWASCTISDHFLVKIHRGWTGCFVQSWAPCAVDVFSTEYRNTEQIVVSRISRKTAK